VNEKILNEGNQIHNFISSSGSETVINYGSGSDFLKSCGSGFASQKVTVPVTLVKKLRFLRFRFRFHNTESESTYFRYTVPYVMGNTGTLLTAATTFFSAAISAFSLLAVAAAVPFPFFFLAPPRGAYSSTSSVFLYATAPSASAVQSVLFVLDCSSVADPDPSDSYVFEPPGSGPFYHQAKIVRKTLIPNVFLLLFDSSILM
jgi:hypothetical protein